MKATKENIEKLENGYIGTIIDKRFGMSNLLNHCYKNGNEIRVEDVESQGPTFFTIDEFVNVYQNRTLQIM